MRASLALMLALSAPAWADIPAPCTGCKHTPEQAGYPPCIGKCAHCGRTCKYAVGYVGGGCLGCCGEVRRLDEGTFGWDYDGGWKCGRVFLNWCHCGKSPKPGPYKVDGPHVPDVGAIHPVKDAIAEKKKSPCHEPE